MDDVESFSTFSTPSTPPTPSPALYPSELTVPESPPSQPMKPCAALSEAASDTPVLVNSLDGTASPDALTMSAAPAEDCTPKLPKAKAKARTGPLRLLDLPMDILKEIIQQLPHTNDLTSLALCHSALHRLAIPCIYSRFDIVWPDESTHTEPRTGVDALTFGLATLVMGGDSFPNQARRRQSAHEHQASDHATSTSPALYPLPRRRLGNYYAQFTRKFSLGNGPTAWVQEYMIAKEGGKMLGTLVALAVARMVNLETFIWDMPTGVLRDVWLALSSLADREDGDDCRLDRLWVRWHDNTLDSPAPPPAPPILNNPPAATTQPSGVGTVPPPMVAPVTFPPSTISAIDRVEHPTFSVIPAVRSLSVLDIDELPYLDEMSILIARSQQKLRELRVGIAAHAQSRDWVTAWEGDGIQQVDYSTTSTAKSSIGEKRLGGVLGILVGRVHNMRQTEERLRPSPDATELPTSGETSAKPASTVSAQPASDSAQEHDAADDGSESPANGDAPADGATTSSVPAQLGADTAPAHSTQEDGAASSAESSTPRATSFEQKGQYPKTTTKEPLLDGQLKLEVLELERVPLSVSVLLKALEWPMLTTLTLLNCNNHEQLWKSLRRTYTPRSPIPPGSPSTNRAYRASYSLRTEYALNLKKIHTNTVSPALISFLKETLAPNTLEVLFLQEGRSYSSNVTVDAIYRGPLRRHRASLKKLMIDSSEKRSDGHPTTANRWRKWMLTHEILTFITSGRMSSLRELAVSIDYKDWHHFLQRLPLIPHVRSLYIPFIADHVHGNSLDPRELAMQILDIVHLRPEIEICYMGIMTKCYEILENRPSKTDSASQDGSNGASNGGGAGPGTGYPGHHHHDPLLASDDESEATEDDEDDFDDAGLDADTSSEETEDDGGSSDDDSFAEEEKKPNLRIREILFYEEKIETLKARHGTLKP